MLSPAWEFCHLNAVTSALLYCYTQYFLLCSAFLTFLPQLKCSTYTTCIIYILLSAFSCILSLQRWPTSVNRFTSPLLFIGHLELTPWMYFEAAEDFLNLLSITIQAEDFLALTLASTNMKKVHTWPLFLAKPYYTQLMQCFLKRVCHCSCLVSFENTRHLGPCHIFHSCKNIPKVFFTALVRRE